MGTTILALKIRDFQGIRAATLQNLPSDGLITVQGPVGAGKTSILKAIEAALGGKAHVHERAVNDEGDGFEIDLELTNGFRIDRHSTPANPKGALAVIGPDDGKYGQTSLDEFVGPLSFDPLSFIGLPLAKQSEIVLALDSDVERPKRIAKIRADRDVIVEERKPLNSEMMKLKNMRIPEGERPEPVDVSATAAKLKVLASEAEASKASQREADAVLAKNAKAAEKSDLSFAKVEEAREALKLAEEAHKANQAAERACETEVKAAQKAVLPGPDPEEVERLEKSLENANDLTKALAPWEEWDRATARRWELKEEIEKFDKLVDERRAEEIAEFAAIKMPIQGMTVDDTGQVLWRDRPLEMASGGERISIAVAVAFAVNPELRICLLDEANNIGVPQLEALDKAAKERGFQIWACRLEGLGTITVESGVAKL